MTDIFEASRTYDDRLDTEADISSLQAARLLVRTLEMMRVQDEARNKPPFNAPPFTNIVFTTKLPAGAWAFIAQNTSRPTGAKPA